MRNKTVRFKYLKKAISDTKKIGVRSISDIISGSSMSFSQKINYIRHHYTYYEGNYDLFANEDGSPNSRKFELNSLILDIINGKKTADELKEFNKKILEWRKDADNKNNQEKERLLEHFDGSSIRERMQWERDINNARITAHEYITLIEKYLEDNPEEKENCKTKSYREMKEIAILWDLDKKHHKDDKNMTPGEYFRQTYFKRINDSNTVSSCLDLICKYLDSKENRKYKRELLEIVKTKILREEAIQWAILKYINHDETIAEVVEKCPDKIKNRIKSRAGMFDEEDENGYSGEKQ